LMIIILAIFFITQVAEAAMTSTNYQIQFDSINSGGTDFSTSTNYQLSDTVGEQGTGYSTSTNYLLHAGYRQTSGIASSLEFVLGAQENATQTAYTALSIAGKTVTVADTSNFATNTRIGVVENQGLSENVVVGQITAINGLVITVDNWDGATGVIGAVPAGGDDWVYRTEGYQISYGTLSLSGAAGLVQTEITTTAANGYTLQIQADGTFRTGSGYTIDDVADGTVTAGQEELTDIQTSTSTATGERIGMVYKASIGVATLSGHYEQQVTYFVTANF